MDDSSLPPNLSPWICVFILLLCAAYLAVTETALASVSRNRIKALADRGEPGAKQALWATDRFDDAIAAILVGTNITHLAAAAIVTVQVTRLFGLSYVTLSTILTTAAVFFFGELLPKSIAKKYPEKCTLACAGVLCVLMKLLSPVSKLLARIGNAAAAHANEDPELSVTEDEIIDIIEDMEEEGTLDEESSDLIQAAVEFSDVHVQRIMTKREDILALDIKTDPEAILDTIQATTHSRIPVYRGDVDHILGVLQVRTFMKEYIKSKQLPPIRKMLDPVYFVKRTMDADELLEQMSFHKASIAIVQDKGGKTLGLVSIEDILEELVGEIYDEEEGGKRK